jgi:hypothetical protein
VLCPIANTPQRVFLRLSNELILFIFNHLSPLSRCNLARTPRRFSVVAKEQDPLPVSSPSSHGSAVTLTDYDWVFCYSAYYSSYAGRRGDGIKWHDRKKVKSLHCIIKQQLEAIGAIYSWGLYTAVHWRSKQITCLHGHQSLRRN